MLVLFSIFFSVCISLSHNLPNTVKNHRPSREDVYEAIKGTYFKSATFSTCNRTASETSFPGKNVSQYIRFYLYSRDTGLSYSEIILGNQSSITKSNFEPDRTTKVLIHGWLDSPFHEFGRLTRRVYLASDQDVNLLYVDWSKVADTIMYPLAWAEAVPVGKVIAQFLDWLVTEVGVSVDNIHVIGHSLGGQIAGITGEHVTVGKIGRISGLDPAGPGFGFAKSGRLDSSDAQFVDVIHTCGHWSGYYYPSGHVDFYPNRGMYNQPGCSWDIGGCSHLRVYHLWAESVYSLGFLSRECSNWREYVKGSCENNTATVMGEHVDRSARGRFYLHTAGSSPFALMGSVVETSRG